MDDRIERPFGLPDFLYTEREDLRVLPSDLLPLEIRLRQHPARSLGQHGDLRDEVVRGLGGRKWPALAIQAGLRRAHAGDTRTLCEEARSREPREQVDAERDRKSVL